ncbi:MAG: PilT/PilU family type 4a pilus ATPase [Candidatus Eisenbacteria sp.]|nr:PilT/PilU family type 4a pilus ATPase [Candidatus Eisenbacteria bacterium]
MPLDIEELLREAMGMEASDVHLQAGSAPSVRVRGEIRLMERAALTPQELTDVSDDLMNPRQRRQFEEKREVDFAIGVADLGRFRANFFRQRGSVAAVFRCVPTTVPPMESLNLPPQMVNLCMKRRGLVLVTGSVGSGKSTTLASMIRHINETAARRILTIEDPIEFLHRNDKSIIIQRDVGVDTISFAEALRHSLRQDPDALMVGEIRDAETMAIAITAANTGHLVMSTLHTVDAMQTINRLISFFPPHQHDEIRFLLASCLEAIVCLRLVPRSDVEGRIPATEIMVSTGAIREYLLDPGKTSEIRAAIQGGVEQYGMQTFDQSLMRLYREEKISLETARDNSSSPAEFDMRAKGIEASADQSWKGFDV